MAEESGATTLDSGATTTESTETTGGQTATVTTDDAGHFADGFTDETLKGYIQNYGFKEVEDLASSYQNLQKLNSGSGSVIQIPPDDAEAPEWDAFFNQLGRPESPTNYDLGLPEGVAADEKRIEWFRNTAHKLGLTNKQAAALAAEDVAFMGAATEAAQREAQIAAEKGIAEVRERWGSQYDENLAAGQRAVKKLDMNDEELTSIENAIGTPALMNLMAQLGKSMGEPGFITGGDSGFVETQAQAKAEMDRLGQDKAFQDSLFDRNNAAHRGNVEKWQRLQQKAFSGGPMNG